LAWVALLASGDSKLEAKTKTRADRTDSERELEQNETGRTTIEGSTEKTERGKWQTKRKSLPGLHIVRRKRPDPTRNREKFHRHLNLFNTAWRSSPYLPHLFD
jgi:hypothetical protein